MQKNPDYSKTFHFIKQNKPITDIIDLISMQLFTSSLNNDNDPLV